MSDLQYFDPKRQFTVSYKTLPHWAQAGTVCFITWRAADSLPVECQKRITVNRREILRRHGLSPNADWKKRLATLSAVDRGRVQWSLYSAWDDQLDRGAGACHLADPAISKIILDALLYFDNERYVVTDAVVMPNHVHVLAAFCDEDALLTQCTSWKRFTSARINAALGKQGEFWQVEQFDHLVRSPEQFDHYRRYIAENPCRAGLADGSYRHYARALPSGQ